MVERLGTYKDHWKAVDALNDAVENNKSLYEKGSSFVSAGWFKGFFLRLRGYQKTDAKIIEMITSYMTDPAFVKHLQEIQKVEQKPSVCPNHENEDPMLRMGRNLEKFLERRKEYISQKGDYQELSPYANCAIAVHNTAIELFQASFHVRVEQEQMRRKERAGDVQASILLPLPEPEDLTPKTPILSRSLSPSVFEAAANREPLLRRAPSPSLSTASTSVGSLSTPPTPHPSDSDSEEEYQIVHHDPKELLTPPAIDPESFNIADGKWLKLEDEHIPLAAPPAPSAPDPQAAMHYVPSSRAKTQPVENPIKRHKALLRSEYKNMVGRK